MTAPLTVLLPTHGRAPLLARLLDSLAACRLPDAYRETVVVENGAPAGTDDLVADAAASHPALRLRYLHVEWANKSYALNEALATVEDGLVVFFDDDLRLDPDVLQAYAEAAADYDGQAFFGGPMGVDYEAPPPDWLLPHLPFSARGVDYASWPYPHYFLGCNWAAFTADLRDLGGFDPNHGPGSPTGASGQESEMQTRMRRCDFEKVYVPGARVWHWVPKERCSPAWTLYRKYRAGLEKGNLLRARAERRSPVTVAEYAARSALAAARWARWAALRNQAARFREHATLKKHLGVLAAYVAPRQPSADAERTPDPISHEVTS